MFRCRFRTPDENLISQFQHIYADVLQRRDTPRYKPRCRNEGTLHPMIATKCEKNDYLITQPFAPVSLDTTKHEKGWNYFGQPIQNSSEDWGFFSSSLCPSLLDTMTVAGQYSGVYPSIYGATETVLSFSDTHNLCTPTLISDTTSPLCLSTPFILDQQDIQSKRTQCDPQLVSQPMLDAPRLEQPQQVTIAPSVLKRNRDLDLDTASRSIEDVQVDITPGMNSSADYARQRELPHGYDEKFRYKIRLCAPTAVVEHAEQIPVTYLNKGQTYTLSITDSNPPSLNSEPVKYRVYVRVSFEWEEQRCNPAAYWQLWKERWCSNKGIHCGEEALAVEYDDKFHESNKDFHDRIRIERTMIDGFCITWTANPASNLPNCSIPVRFNFVSTDFQRSKGVKGMPVRLGVKTQILAPDVDASKSLTSEMCYCKVKLFRDHGAERRMSHDVLSVKKTIAKLELQIANHGKGSEYDRRKRRRTRSKRLYNGLLCESRPGDNLRAEISILESMFSSTRPVSVLGLRGDAADDPDLHPIWLPRDLVRLKDLDFTPTKSTGDESTADIVVPFIPPLVPSPMNNSVAVTASPDHPCLVNTSKMSAAATAISPCARSVPEQGIMAIDYIAGHYPRAIACLYIKFATTQSRKRAYYHAVYLTERTERCLVHKLAEKQRIDPAKIVRVLHVNKAGLHIMVDDDFVRELSEGQNMVAELEVIHESHSTTGTSSHSNAIADSECTTSTTSSSSSMRVELRLIY